MFEALAIKKLEELKREAQGESVPHFSFFPRFGICWHLFANTKETEIGSDYLAEAFTDLGLDDEYPVETQVYGKDNPAVKQVNWYGVDKYNPSTECGQARLKLIDDLIQYFQNKL